VDDAAYRIVQESLTNVLRHASQRSAQVHVHHGPGSLELCVTDDGAPGPGPAAQGWGLRGMRERAILLGGTVQAGPRDDGPGWRVAAHLPAPPAPS
jgi:signal transduction histidine kinase